MRPFLLFGFGLAIIVQTQATSAEDKGHAPLWMQDLKQHNKFLDAVREQREIGQALGADNSHASAAAQAETAAADLHRQEAAAREAEEDTPNPKLGESHDVENEGEISSESVTALDEPATPKTASKQMRDSGKATHSLKTKDLGDSVGQTPATSAPSGNASGTPPPTMPPKHEYPKGDKAGYPQPLPPPPPIPAPAAPTPPPEIPEAFADIKEPEVKGLAIKPNLNSFMYYGRMVSFYLMPVKKFQDRLYLKLGNEEKLVLDTMGQVNTPHSCFCMP